MLGAKGCSPEEGLRRGSTWLGSLCTVSTLGWGCVHSLLEQTLSNMVLVRKGCHSLCGIGNLEPGDLGCSDTIWRPLSGKHYLKKKKRNSAESKIFRRLASMFILLSQNRRTLLVQFLGHKPEQTVPGNEKQPYLKWTPHPRNEPTEEQTQNWGCHSGFHSAFFNWPISTCMIFWLWTLLMGKKKKKGNIIFSRISEEMLLNGEIH